MSPCWWGAGCVITLQVPRWGLPGRLRKRDTPRPPGRPQTRGLSWGQAVIRGQLQRQHVVSNQLLKHKTCQPREISLPFLDFFLLRFCCHMEMSSSKQYRCEIKVWAFLFIYVQFMLPHIKFVYNNNNLRKYSFIFVPSGSGWKCSSLSWFWSRSHILITRSLKCYRRTWRKSVPSSDRYIMLSPCRTNVNYYSWVIFHNFLLGC